jgi:cell division protein FtsW (lipid II flippase)
MMQFTSLLFATNAAHAYSRNYLFYAVLLVLLSAASVAWHSSPKLESDSMSIFWIDQAFIWATIVMSVFYATRMRSPLYKSLFAMLALATIALSIYLVFGCQWDREYSTEHSTFHGIASLCLHCVIAGL